MSSSSDIVKDLKDPSLRMGMRINEEDVPQRYCNNIIMENGYITFHFGRSNGQKIVDRVGDDGYGCGLEGMLGEFSIPIREINSNEAVIEILCEQLFSKKWFDRFHGHVFIVWSLMHLGNIREREVKITREEGANP